MKINEMIDSAKKALAAYPVGTDVRDLLTDLMHLCDARDVNFDEDLVMARANYRREVTCDNAN